MTSQGRVVVVVLSKTRGRRIKTTKRFSSTSSSFTSSDQRREKERDLSFFLSLSLSLSLSRMYTSFLNSAKTLSLLSDVFQPKKQKKQKKMICVLCVCVSSFLFFFFFFCVVFGLLCRVVGFYE